jgi:hypothetical protein
MALTIGDDGGDSGPEAREVPARIALTAQGGWKIFNVHVGDIAVLTDATGAGLSLNAPRSSILAIRSRILALLK